MSRFRFVLLTCLLIPLVPPPSALAHGSHVRPCACADYQNTQGVIFVVDSNDRDRLSQAKDELHGLLDQFELRDAVVLVYANKQDLPNAAPAAQLAEALQLSSLRGRKWYIQACCATTGDGLYEGLDWLKENCPSKPAS